MNLLSDDLLLGDILFPFNQTFLEADEGLGLLDDSIEVSGYLPSHGFSIAKAKNGVSEQLPLAEPFGIYKGDAFSCMDWMVEKMDLKVFDFDSLLDMEDLESTISPDELMATLDDSCDLLEDPPLPSLIGQYVPLFTPDSLPESPLEANQVTPVSQSLAKSNFSSPDHSFILDVGSEVDVAEEDKKSSAISIFEMPKYEKEESLDNDSGIFMNSLLKSDKEDSSDNDSGVCMSPSDLGSPQRSPTFTVEYPSSVQSSPDSPVSERPKPYDLPKNKEVLAKVKSVGQPRVDKHKKMEQNKTAATRYRQKKKAEQEVISAECRELEKKNDSLQEKADSLAKEIQYLKDLLEEVRKAKSKRAKSS